MAVWNSGLHRYFEDEQAIQILQDIAKLKQGTVEEGLANEFLLYFARINEVDISTVPEKNGALKKMIFLIKEEKVLYANTKNKN